MAVSEKCLFDQNWAKIPRTYTSGHLQGRSRSSKKPFNICKLIGLKGQGIFSLDKNKILRLQVTLDSPHAKNVSISQTALFLYEICKFLDTETFGSTNFVKVQVS